MNSAQRETRPYFGGLDAIRTYAFLIVFVSHGYFSFFTVTDLGTRWFAHGEVGVQMFFVLSAFLITYLSLSEYAKTKSFSLLHFFKKRILRIWPLYVLVLSISYVWYTLAQTAEPLGCLTQFLYFFGNACMIQGSPHIIEASAVAPMWSVSVEQQFYVVFPLAFLGCIYLYKKIGKPRVVYTVHAILVTLFMWALYVRYLYAYDWNYISYAVLTSLPAFIGGIYLAYGVHRKSPYIQHIRAHAGAYSVSAFVLFFSFMYIKFQGAIGVSLYVLPIIYTTCIWIIVATREQSSENKDSENISLYTKTVQYLGKISYGLYAYHMFAIVLSQYVFAETSSWFEGFAALVFTVCFAHVSFVYFESWFLKFK